MLAIGLDGYHFEGANAWLSLLKFRDSKRLYITHFVINEYDVNSRLIGYTEVDDR